MSGSGGADDWKFRATADGIGGIGGSGGGESSKCEFRHSTQLNSPVPAVLATLHAGDILEIILTTNNIVLAKKTTGEIAGSITYKHLVTLIECIEEGWSYSALIISLEGGACEIQITPRAQ